MNLEDLNESCKVRKYDFINQGFFINQFAIDKDKAMAVFIVKMISG